MCVVARTQAFFRSTLTKDLIFEGRGPVDQCSEQLSPVFLKRLPDARKRSTINTDV